MWNNYTTFLIVRVKLKWHRWFVFPVPLWVADEFCEALAELAWAGEKTLKCIPYHKDHKDRKLLSWINTISPSHLLDGLHNMVLELSRQKGLDIIEVETGEVKVKISLK
ncbi:hypothetical protein [Desulfosporosinus sp. FKA]|uniref:hypothetical protein n=1 Tax=Desulfosporosinus sp. FKA TaxID=1969834 RepID=UPI000B4A2D89|nr:hypothetical protein [Desulfosporosinus sp. FKA]